MVVRPQALLRPRMRRPFRGAGGGERGRPAPVLRLVLRDGSEPLPRGRVEEVASGGGNSKPEARRWGFVWEAGRQV